MRNLVGNDQNEVTGFIFSDQFQRVDLDRRYWVCLLNPIQYIMIQGFLGSFFQFFILNFMVLENLWIFLKFRRCWDRTGGIKLNF